MEGHLCEKCNKEVRQEQRGSLTQWIFDSAYCSCERLALHQGSTDKAKNLCSKCFNVKVSRRSGSITQWIFKRYQCTCDSDVNENAVSERSTSISTDGRIQEPEAEEVFNGSEFPFTKERYKPLGYIARSAASIVYKCFDRQLGRTVAIKTLLFADTEIIVRFQQEARATALLRHANIVEVLDFGIGNGGAAYMVMEFVDATDLADWLQSKGPCSETKAIAMISGVCRALDYAHSKGIYHRDVKPQNILLNKNGEPKLIDFGLALVLNPQQEIIKTQGLSLSGTPSYMSPDQFLGRPYDVRSEVYSLGCVLFDCLTGRPPFQGETALEIARKHAETEAPTLHEANPDHQFSERLEHAIGRCLQKNPNDRYSSITELAKDLQIELTASNHESTLTAGQINAAKNALESSSLSPVRGGELAGLIEPGSRLSIDTLSRSQRTIINRKALLLVPLLVLIPIVAWILLEQRPVEPAKSKPLTSHVKPRPGSFQRAATTNFDVGPVLDKLQMDHTRDIMKRDQGVYTDITLTPGPIDLLATAPPKFYFLSFRNCDGVTPDILKRLTPMHLRNLRFSGCDVDNSGMAAVASLPYLKMVELESCPRVNNQGYAELKKSRKLNAIAILRTNIDAKTIPVLCQLKLDLIRLSRIPNFDESWLETLRSKQLYDVRLDDINVTDRGLQHVLKLPSLRNICANYLQITDKSVEALSRCSGLEYVDLQGNKKITDRSVRSLLYLYENCKYPKELNIRVADTGITIRSIPLFKKMKNIKSLDLRNLIGVDSAVVADLRKALPNTAINDISYSLR